MKRLMLLVLGLGLMVSPGGVKAQAIEPGMMLGNVQSAIEAIRTQGTKPMRQELDDKTRARVQEILAQIAKLQAELRGLVGNSGVGYLATDPVYPMPMACRMFQRDLKLGDKGEEVKALKEALKQKMEAALVADLDESEVFDAKLEQKIKLLQEKNLGIAAGQAPGNLGPKTRAWLNGRCGAGAVDPVVTTTDSDSVFSFNLKSSVVGTDAEGGTHVVYSVETSAKPSRFSYWTLQVACPVSGIEVSMKGGWECGEKEKVLVGNTWDVWYKNTSSKSKTVGVTAQLLSEKDGKPIAADKDALTIAPTE